MCGRFRAGVAAAAACLYLDATTRAFLFFLLLLPPSPPSGLEINERSATESAPPSSSSSSLAPIDDNDSNSSSILPPLCGEEGSSPDEASTPPSSSTPNACPENNANRSTSTPGDLCLAIGDPSPSTPCALCITPCFKGVLVLTDRIPSPKSKTQERSLTTDTRNSRGSNHCQVEWHAARHGHAADAVRNKLCRAIEAAAFVQLHCPQVLRLISLAAARCRSLPLAAARCRSLPLARYRSPARFKAEVGTSIIMAFTAAGEGRRAGSSCQQAKMMPAKWGETLSKLGKTRFMIL